MSERFFIPSEKRFEDRAVPEGAADAVPAACEEAEVPREADAGSPDEAPKERDRRFSAREVKPEENRREMAVSAPEKASATCFALSRLSSRIFWRRATPVSSMSTA